VLPLPLEAQLAGPLAVCRRMDSRESDEQGGMPSITCEYRRPITKGKWGEIDYVKACIEGYGWGR
jgi:hypothetical protein